MFKNNFCLQDDLFIERNKINIEFLQQAFSYKEKNNFSSCFSFLMNSSFDRKSEKYGSKQSKNKTYKFDDVTLTFSFGLAKS